MDLSTSRKKDISSHLSHIIDQGSSDEDNKISQFKELTNLIKENKIIDKHFLKNSSNQNNKNKEKFLMNL